MMNAPRRGFTLIELLIALCISTALFFGASALLNALGQNMSEVNNQVETMRAISGINGVFERMISRGSSISVYDIHLQSPNDPRTVTIDYPSNTTLGMPDRAIIEFDPVTRFLTLTTVENGAENAPLVLSGHVQDVTFGGSGNNGVEVEMSVLAPGSAGGVINFREDYIAQAVSF